MKALQKKIIEITQSDNFSGALRIVFKDYLKLKLFYLKTENSRYEFKNGVSFDEFEKNLHKHPTGTSYEKEQEYYEWEAVITDLEYFSDLYETWK